MSWVAAATIGTSLIGAKAQRDAAKAAGSSTTTTGPTGAIAGQYDTFAGDIQNLRDRGLLGAVKEYSPYEQRLIEAGMARAEAGDPFQAAGEQAVSQILGGGLLGEAADIYRQPISPTMESPEFQAAASRAVEQAMRPVTSKFAVGGRLGSQAFADALTDASASAFSPLALQARQQDMNLGMQRAAGLSGLAGQQASTLGTGVELGRALSSQPFTDIGRGLQLGGLLTEQEFQLQRQPVLAAQEFGDLIKLGTFGTQTTQPLYAPSSGSMVGGALMAAAPQIGQAVANYRNRPEGQVIQGTGNFTLPDGTRISGTTGFEM